MSNFFVKDEVYQERMEICRGCVFYKKLLGNCSVCKCFMKIKSRISVMECPKKYWGKTKEVERLEEVPEELIEEVLLIWKDIKNGQAKNQTVKKKMVELYNTIHGTNYKPNSNCGTCLNNCYHGLRQIVEKHKI